MTLSRTAWYVKLYFICAWFQRALYGRPYTLPEPRSICMLFRMYVWGLLSFVALVICWSLFILVGLAALGGSTYGFIQLIASLFRHDRMGEMARMSGMLFLGTIAFAIVVVWAEEQIAKRFPKKAKAKKPRPLPAITPGRRGRSPSFGEVFAERLKNLDERYCTPITLE